MTPDQLQQECQTAAREQAREWARAEFDFDELALGAVADVEVDD